MSSGDYDIDFDRPCPLCSHHYTHTRRCANIFCESGLIPDGDGEDQMYPEYAENCEQCKGTGFENWCPSCGKDVELTEEEEENETKN